jgi:hypothetical protein
MKDPAVSKLSPAARGIWIDFLCAMHENDRSGVLTGTTDQLSRLGRCPASVLDRTLSELSTSGTAIVSERNGIYSVTNRRMYRESHARFRSRIRKERQRLRQMSRDGPAPSSISSSLSGVREPLRASPPPSGGAPPKPAPPARGGGPKSRFSLEQCQAFAHSVKGLKSPDGFAKTIWRSGEDDARIAAFLEPKAQIAETKKPVDVAELQALADELERMDLKDQAAALRAGLET